MSSEKIAQASQFVIRTYIYIYVLDVVRDLAYRFTIHRGVRAFILVCVCMFVLLSGAGKVDAAFPTVAATSSGNSTGNVTSTGVTLPSGISVGDLLIVFFMKDGVTRPGEGNYGSDWTRIGEDLLSGTNYYMGLWKIAEGSDTLTITHESQGTAYAAYRITGHGNDAGTPPEAGTSVIGTSANPNPPSLTPSWGSGDTLWIASYGWDANNSHTSYPANYTSNQVTNRWAHANGAGIAASTRNNATATEDPGTATIGSTDWIAQTFAVKARAIGTSTFSGTVYLDEGGAATTSGVTVSLTIGTSTKTTYSTTTNASGVWSIDVPNNTYLTAGTPIVAWVDGNTDFRAVLFTKASTSNSITGLDLYKNRVFITHEGTSGTSTTIADLAFYDSDYDADIQFNAATGTVALTVFANQELHVKTGKTFAPGGTVTIQGMGSSTSPTDGSIHLPGTATYTAGGTTTISGNLYASSTATYTHNSYPLNFVATTTGKTVSVPLSSMGHVVFNGSGGGWTIGTTSTSTDFTITNGSVTAPSTTLAVRGNFINSGTFSHNSGTLFVSSTTAQTLSGTLVGTSAFNHVVLSGASTKTFSSNASTTNFTIDTGATAAVAGITIQGNYTNNGSYSSTATTTFSSTSPQTLSGTMIGSSADFGDIAFIGTSTKTFSSNASTSGNFLVDYGATVVFPSSLTVSVFNASYINNGTTTAGVGTTTFTNTSVTLPGTIRGNLTGTSAFYTLAFGSVAAGGITISDNASTTNVYMGVSGTIGAPPHLSISGNFINNSTGGMRTSGVGTTTFNGTTAQTATGTMSGTTYQFDNIQILNNTATTSFGSAVTARGQFTAVTPGSRIAFSRAASSTFGRAVIAGSSGNEIWIRSVENGAVHYFSATTSYDISYVNVKDSNSCFSFGGGISGTGFVNGSNNTCWNFGGSAITLSGTLYSDEGATTITTGKTILAAVGTSTPSLHTATSDGSGAYSMTLDASHTLSTTTPILLWVDNDATTRAALFTKASSSVNNIASLDLYQNRVIISHEGTSGTSTTISNMAFYDGTDDSDIQYIATTTTNTLTVRAGNKLYIKENKTFSPGGHVMINASSSASSTDGSLLIASGATYTAGGMTTIGGNFNASSTATFEHNGYSLVMNGTTTGKMVHAGITSVGDISFTGNGGSFTFATSATTSNFIVGPGATVTAPTLLKIEGTYANIGIFLNNGGTVTLASSSAQTIGGVTATSSAFNNLTIAGTGPVSFSGSYTAATTTSAGAGIHAAAIDTVNQVLYQGFGGGLITRCSLATGCNTGGDFTVATATGASIGPMIIDTVNSTLYVGSNGTGLIYRCALSTGCDDASDYTIATSTAGSNVSTIRSFTIDTTNGVLYAGTGSVGVILRCVLSTGCSNTTDFTVATDTPASLVMSLGFDATNGAVYAGTGGAGVIYKCVVATGCVNGFTIATDTPETTHNAIAIDSINGVLYIGSQNNHRVYRCVLSTGCTGVNDWTLPFDGPDSVVADMYIDQVNNALYIGGDTRGVVYRCLLATGCDESADFTAAVDTPATTISAIVSDTSGNLYASASDGVVYRCVFCYATTSYSTTTNIGNLTVETGATLSQNYEMSISGDYTNNGTSTVNTYAGSPSFVFSGSSAQSISGGLIGSSSLPSVTFRGSGTKTFQNNASTSGSFSIDTVSTVVAPASLTVGGSFQNDGTFTKGSGIVYLTGPGATASGTLTDTSAFNALTINANIASATVEVFTTATDTSAVDMYTFAIDSNNHVLYSGASTNIYRCVLSTDCDSTDDFTIATTTEVGIAAMIYDSTNQVLYAGTYTGGIVYRCAVSTGCDSPTDFIVATSTSAAAIRAFTIDTTNQVLYIGGGTSGQIHRCVLATGCDDGTDFTLVQNTATYVFDMEFDVANGALYAVTGGSSRVYRCDVSTSCDASGEFIIATTTSDTTHYSSTIDYTNGVIYVGSGNNGKIHRCVLATDCTVAGGFTVAVDTSQTVIYSLTVDAVNGILYAGTNPGGIIYRCVLSTGCDESADFTTAVDTSETSIASLIADPSVGTLYAGSAASGLIYRRSPSVTFVTNASTNDLSIMSGSSLVAPQQLSVAGNYTNNGTFSHRGGTTTFSGASSQTLAGTLNATSSFSHVAFTGAGTKTFSTNASTTNFLIDSTSGAVAAPTSLTITGHYTNNSTFTSGATTTLSSTTAQVISGIATGTSAFNTLVLQGTSTKTFASNASTSNFIIETNATAILPSLFSISGNYTNNGTTTAGSGTTTFSGTSQQTATGTMTGTSAFYNLAITNTSGLGSTTQSVIFGRSASTTGRFAMVASTSAQFLAGATSTFQNINLQGMSGKRAYLRSSVPNTAWNLVVPGSQEYVSYVDVRDSSACSGNPDISAVDGTSVNAGGNTCWNFGTNVSIASAGNQTFSYGDSATAIQTITVIDDPSTPIITDTNDLRIKIATSTVRMLWDTTDTTPTFGGTASGKIAATVSYEGGGSVLVIDVTTSFGAGDTLTIAGLSFANFTAVNAALPALSFYVGGVNDTSAEATDSATVAIKGTMALADHTSGQVADSFSAVADTDVELFAFKLTPAGEGSEISSLTFALSGVQGVTGSDLTNMTLHRDIDGDKVYDAEDTAVGGSGAVSISGQTGTITFSSSFFATTSQEYLLVGDIADIKPTDSIILSLSGDTITTTGTTTALTITETGSVASVQHIKGGGGGGGASTVIGGAPVAGDGVRVGGGEGGGGEVDPDSGDSIGNEVGFNAPSAESGSWTSGTNAYSSNGAYATANSSVSHAFGSFGFSVPSNNQVTGIAVKLEASGTTAAGTISVYLSWDGGTTFTDPKITDTMGLTDAVFEVGGQGDTWGRSWTPAETNDGSLVVAVLANPSSNTLNLDAIQIKVYHQATGGGGGGGGAVFKESDRYFASVYSAFGGAVAEGVRSIWGWLVK